MDGARYQVEVLTIFDGSLLARYLRELASGGWAAPNVFALEDGSKVWHCLVWGQQGDTFEGPIYCEHGIYKIFTVLDFQ